MAAEKRRKRQFGEVRPIIHTEAWDEKLIGVGSRIYFTDPKASFSDFLIGYLRETFGLDLWSPLKQKHEIGAQVTATRQGRVWTI